MKVLSRLSHLSCIAIFLVIEKIDLRYFAVVKYVLQKKEEMSRFKSILPYSEFLGLHVISPDDKTSDNLSNFVTHPLMLCYLLKKDGYKPLTDFFLKIGLVLAKDGEITSSTPNNKSKNR